MGLDFTEVPEELEHLARASSLDELTSNLQIGLGPEHSGEVIDLALRYFRQAHPAFDPEGCLEWEGARILLRREFLLALTEVLCKPIRQAVDACGTIDVEIGVEVDTDIRPGPGSEKSSGGRLQAIDPLRWRYAALSADERPPNLDVEERALIRLERIKDVMIGSETAVGGPAKMSALVSAVVRLNQKTSV